MAGDFRLNEHRAPGAPMQALNVKVPSVVMAELRSQAERLSGYPSSLARELILRGLSDLAASSRLAIEAEKLAVSALSHKDPVARAHVVEVFRDWLDAARDDKGEGPLPIPRELELEQAFEEAEAEASLEATEF